MPSACSWWVASPMIMLHCSSPAAIFARLYSTSLRTPCARQNEQRPALTLAPSASPSSTSAAPDGSSAPSNSGVVAAVMATQPASRGRARSGGRHDLIIPCPSTAGAVEVRTLERLGPLIVTAGTASGVD
jgi:hypothetical protein